MGEVDVQCVVKPCYRLQSHLGSFSLCWLNVGDQCFSVSNTAAALSSQGIADVESNTQADMNKERRNDSVIESSIMDRWLARWGT